MPIFLSLRPFIGAPLCRIAAVLMLLAGPPAARADEPISTDRPDFVESSEVVGRGRLQIETGFSSERQRADGLDTRLRTTPTLVRLGLNETLELRAETDGFAHSRVHDDGSGITTREHGFSDWSLGLKWHQQDGDEAAGTPGIAWLAHVDIDSGSPAFRGQGLRPSLRMVAEWDLPQDFSVGVMPGFVVDRNDEGERFVAGIFAVTLGKAWSPAWHSFVEVAGQQLASKKNGGSVVTLDAGVTWLVTDSLQLDAAVSRGVTDDSPDFQWGVGLSIPLLTLKINAATTTWP